MKVLRLSIVVPMYNEEANLPELHSRLTGVLQKMHVESEIVYVDDGSIDGTALQLETLLQQSQPVCTRVVRLPHRQGKTAALLAGFGAARGRILVTTDADLQEPPEVLPILVEIVQSGRAHLVVGWRQQRQDPWLRVKASHLFNAVLRWITGVPLHDINCGTKAMCRDVAEQLQSWMVSDMHRYLPVLAARMGYRVAELPVPHVSRRRGRSRFGASRYLRALADLLPVALLWPRGWGVWIALVAVSWLLGLVSPLLGVVGTALCVGWLGWAVRFWLQLR